MHATDLVNHYGPLLIFGNVLVEQLGLPVPALPTLVVAGALAAEGRLSPFAALGAAVAACALADTLWFLLGRRHGATMVRTVCRMSAYPDRCASFAGTLFRRWGLPSLLIGKFMPGFAFIGPPLAGASGAKLSTFLLFATGGSVIWAGSAFWAGAIFNGAVDRAVARLAEVGTIPLAVIGVSLGIALALRLRRRALALADHADHPENA